MTEDDQPQGENDQPGAAPGSDPNAGSVGRVDWGPLAKLTGTRPQVSKYGLPRYSPLEWKLANDGVIGEIPSAAALEHESKNIMTRIAAACDKEQAENTLRLRQRAVDITARHCLVTQYCEELSEEVQQLAKCKIRIRKALEYLGVVEGINSECREIRKNRLEEDLVRDDVEEELFREADLCQQIRQLYMSTLNEFEVQYATIKGCYQEVHSLWSDQRETLELETENIGLNSSSTQISFIHGNVRFEGNMSTKEIWETYMDGLLQSIRDTIEGSRSLRRKIHSPTLADSARDLKQQDERVLKAFVKRIQEETNERKRLEAELEHVMAEIAHAENLHTELSKLGRQVDFNLKVVQTRLENRRHRPGAENCRDSAQAGLIQEAKVINEEVTSLSAQMSKIDAAIQKLYSARKSLERQIHVKRHSLSLDQDRCMRFRSKFPNSAYLLGY